MSIPSAFPKVNAPVSAFHGIFFNSCNFPRKIRVTPFIYKRATCVAESGLLQPTQMLKYLFANMRLFVVCVHILHSACMGREVEIEEDEMASLFSHILGLTYIMFLEVQSSLTAV